LLIFHKIKLCMGFILALAITVSTAGSSFAQAAATTPKTENYIQYITLDQLQELCTAAKGKINKLYIHWSAGKYKKIYPAYHINITEKGRLALTCRSLTELKYHTWHRNQNAIGISICACYNARITDLKANPPQIDWGKYPPTQKQVDVSLGTVLVDTFYRAINKKCVKQNRPR